MKYYIDRRSSTVYAYEADGSQDDFIKEGLERLTAKELAQIRKAQEAASAPTPEQLLQEANAQRDQLLMVAGLRIAPLQDAIDLGESTDADVEALKLWKEYRVAVNRVSQQPGFPAKVEWPLAPDTQTQ